MADNVELKTPLFDLHQKLGAKMVPFAGYQMPVQYPLGIKKEHLHTRSQAGLFDVSHMGQVRLIGKNAAAALETLVPVDIIDLPLMRQRYALFTNPQGGVLDDLMVTNTGDGLFLVINAACKQQDIAHLQKHLADKCEIQLLEDHALLALQGPKAVQVLQQLVTEDLALMHFMNAAKMDINGIECFVTRSGYSGEDGFEISVKNAQAAQLAETLLDYDMVEMIGLGARDSLRLEAGLCLYGHELSENISPLEASLDWALSKARRADGIRPGGYLGADIIMPQLADGVSRKRVGIRPLGKMPVRDGVELFDNNDQLVGLVTSGGFGPSINAPIAMALIDIEQAVLGHQLIAKVRNKAVPVEVAALPFVKQNYYRG